MSMKFKNLNIFSYNFSRKYITQVNSLYVSSNNKLYYQNQYCVI